MKVDKSKFKETKYYLTYQVDTAFHHKDYDIQKSRLNEVREHEEGWRNNDKGFDNVSEWVAHLSGKTWASKRMMLLLCNIIKRIHPDNKINWQETERLINSINYES
jgi:hypothetical protein